MMLVELVAHTPLGSASGFAGVPEVREPGHLDAAAQAGGTDYHLLHDTIPWLVRDDPELRSYDHRLAEWFDRLALAGLHQADGLIADSAFTQGSGPGGRGRRGIDRGGVGGGVRTACTALRYASGQRPRRLRS